jgi:hypothetical protein
MRIYDDKLEEGEGAMIDYSMDSLDDKISKIEKMNIALNSIRQRLHAEEEQRRYGY